MPPRLTIASGIPRIGDRIMAGYIHDPLQIINIIADNLRDRYKSGFPVLKEIIQNADDAGAADAGILSESVQLEFGLSQGLPNANHPLLRGPALYFLNNGTFYDSDYKAIRSFGLNRKAIDQSSIGKFGLGMKSVFHFCEAFFFLAKNTETEKEYAEILNPWSGTEDFPSFHDNWNCFSPSDASWMQQHVQAVFDQMVLPHGSWFLLWLPLRRRSHLVVNGEEVGSIISEFPGDDDRLLSFLAEKELAQQLSSLLPLLRRIDSIRYWQTEGAANIVPHFQVSLRKGANRIGRTESTHSIKQLEGTVTYQHGDDAKTLFSLNYAGRETLLNIPELGCLRRSPLWPKTYIRDDLGMSKEAPDKAKGHGAVVFSRSNEKERGRLKISWAVFLPVDSAKEEVICEGNSCYRLTLHGYFFVDAGRVGIEGFQEEAGFVDDTAEPQNEVELRRMWNLRLARRGTLPLILAALEGFVQKARLSAEDAWNLTNGLKSSKLFQHHKKTICGTSIWVCCLTQKGKEWRILPSNAWTLPLPSPPASAPERPWKTFTKLEALESKGVVLLLNDAPHLLSRPLPQWDEEFLMEVLQLNEKGVFAEHALLEYLITFLAEPAVRPFLNIGILQSRLQEILKKAFIGLGTLLRQNRKQVQEFSAFISEGRRYVVNRDAPEIIRELQRCSTQMLIIAKEFDSPEISGKARLSLEDALTLLERLHELIGHFEQIDHQGEIDHCRAIAREILQGQDEEQRQYLLVRAKNLRILEGYDCLAGGLAALSAAELENCRDSQLLFLYSQGTTEQQRWGLAPKLQRTISERVLLVRSETASLIWGRSNSLVPCHADSVLDSVGENIKALQSVEKRRDLLPDLAGADLSSDRRVRGMRYLLHGIKDRFHDNSTLWVSGYEQSPAWRKLWQQLESHCEDGWNLVERKLVEEIPPNKWKRLAIREIKPEDILDELREKGTDEISGERFNPGERNAVLQKIVADENLWRALPFHETVTGVLARVSSKSAFIETDILLPDELHTLANIIRRSTDPIVRRQQSDWLPLLSSDAVISIALRHEKPSKFWRLILDHLETSEHSLETRLLQDTAWLLDSENCSVKPSDVLYLERMQDEVDRLLAVARGAFWSPGKLHKDLYRGR